MKEGVLSGLFEVIWMHPCQTPKPKANGSDAPSLNGTPRGKGREREWVKEVERARSGDDSKSEAGGKYDERWFDWDTMENVYAGYCNERCRVLCTVELGLAFSRRLPEEEHDSESVDGDGMVVTHVNGYESRPPSGSGAGRPVSMGGVGMDGVRRNLSMSSSGGETVVRNLLLKPKVLLESVVDIL